ncbi:UDP-N-acetylglucosamine--undecaprenyl-phosphate N-acetylglucosaminephosphotransferase [Vibrio sinaloensis]|uniref:UDP-N-acetylglucosamine--undecaprenyl-phosphate N-acetylglucosaminephosphotransferase n=1 Tax=Photobacterium sp. (strain ATCC 43367) TaxID=379097 RepID=UPI0035EB003A
MQLFITTIVIFALSTLSLIYLRPLAIRLNFVDVPMGRKSHNGHIPLVGGLSTLLGVWVIALAAPDSIPYQLEYTGLATFLVAVGLIDDKLDISAISRLIVIAAVSVWLVKGEGIALEYLGDIIGTGQINLGSWTLLFTIAAVIGCVTAFNMVDGIDGLLGALASVSIASLGILFWLSGHSDISTFCYLFVVAMLPYICCNLGLKVKSKYKVFMGDSGSFLVGFTIIWLLVFATQDVELDRFSTPPMKPVTALWIIAIPLMDMALVMLRRMLTGHSPFCADRTHIHHVLISFGMPAKVVLVTVFSFAFLIAMIGVLLDVSATPESTSFLLFLLLFCVYCSSLVLIQINTKETEAAVEQSEINV